MTFARFATALLLAGLCAAAVGCGGTDRSPEAVAASLRAVEVRQGGVERVTCVERNADAFDCGLDQKVPELSTAFHYQVRLSLRGDCWKAAAGLPSRPIRGCLQP